MPILVDTGVLIASIDGSDVDHADAAAVFELYAGRLVVPSTVEAESSWQLEKNISAPDDDYKSASKERFAFLRYS